jgi:hypothetical protein
LATAGGKADEGPIMIRAKATALAVLVAGLAASGAKADDVRYVTEGGVRYQETTQTVQRPITEWRSEPRQQTVYQERYTTNMQESVRTYQVPITEQQWVPGYQRTWNIFAPPVLSYRLLPVTRWETRSETVKIPITKREYVPQQQVQHVQVPSTKIAEEKIVRRVAIGLEGSGTQNVARSDSFEGAGVDDNPPVENSSTPMVGRRR